jgi:hypothetical protein
MSDHRTTPTVTVGSQPPLSAAFTAAPTDLARKRPRAWSLKSLPRDYIIQSESVYNGCGRITPHSVV